MTPRTRCAILAVAAIIADVSVGIALSKTGNLWLILPMTVLGLTAGQLSATFFRL